MDDIPDGHPIRVWRYSRMGSATLLPILRDRAFLRERGCREIQGYLLSRPVPAENIPAFIIEHDLKKGLSI